MARALLSLPHSSANIERGFSQFKLIKNERRTNLSNDSLESLIIAKINKIELQDSKVVDTLFELYNRYQLQKKRNNSRITASSPKIKPNSLEIIIELEVPSDQESISDKFKKVKLNYKSFPQ